MTADAMRAAIRLVYKHEEITVSPNGLVNIHLRNDSAVQYEKLAALARVCGTTHIFVGTEPGEWGGSEITPGDPDSLVIHIWSTP